MNGLNQIETGTQDAVLIGKAAKWERPDRAGIGRQLMRPTTPLRTVTRTQQQIVRPEEQAERIEQPVSQPMVQAVTQAEPALVRAEPPVMQAEPPVVPAERPKAHVEQPVMQAEPAIAQAEPPVTKPFTQPAAIIAPAAELPAVVAPAVARQEEPPRRFGRTMNALKTLLPLVQHALPLLEGNVAGTIANLLLAAPPSARVDLEPIERRLAALQAQQKELGGKIGEQGAALKSIGDRLEDVKEATERHAGAQLEMTENLEGLRRRMGRIAWIGFLLLAVSIGLNVALYLRISGNLH